MKYLLLKALVFVSILVISATAQIRAGEEEIVIQPDKPYTEQPCTEPIPEPASIFLLGSGLAGMAGIGLRKKR